MTYWRNLTVNGYLDGMCIIFVWILMNCINLFLQWSYYLFQMLVCKVHLYFLTFSSYLWSKASSLPQGKKICEKKKTRLKINKRRDESERDCVYDFEMVCPYIFQDAFLRFSVFWGFELCSFFWWLTSYFVLLTHFHFIS